MENMENIDVVIPYYKAKKTVFKTIESLLNAGIQEKQILLVDDDSKDDIDKELSSRFSHIKYVKNTCNRGAGVSRSVGFSQGICEWVLFIDSDIYFEREHFHKLINNSSSHDIIFPKLLYEDSSLVAPNTDWEKRYCMWGGVFLLNRKAAEQLDELFDETYFFCNEDSDFFLRCRAFGLRFKYVADSVFIHPQRNKIISEKIYYLTTRNVIYLSAKLWGIADHRMPYMVYLSGYTFMNFIMAVLNRSIKFTPLTIEKTTYSTNRFARIRLVFLFFSALAWNIYNIPAILKKRAAVKKALARAHLT